MRKYGLVFILSILSILNAIAQKDTNVISVPRMDSSPLNFRISHLWTEKSNDLIVDNNIIKIWTDNGIIDTGSFYYGKYRIKPKINGQVIIYSLLKIKNDKDNFDTIDTKTVFTSISQPNIISIIDKENLKANYDIKVSFVFFETKKSIKGSRYQLGAISSPYKIYNDKTLLGKVDFLTDIDEKIKLLKAGNIIHVPIFMIRDMKTDLIIGTPEYDYKYK